MYEKQLTIENPTGLHARPASQLTTLCKGYSDTVTILCGETEINPKSIVSVLSGGVKKGSGVIVRVVGPEEEKVGNEIVAFLQNLKE